MRYSTYACVLSIYMYTHKYNQITFIKHQVYFTPLITKFVTMIHQRLLPFALTNEKIDSERLKMLHKSSSIIPYQFFFFGKQHVYEVALGLIRMQPRGEKP